MSPIERDISTYMQAAYAVALKGMENGEVPVGAVVVHDGAIIARTHNQVETLHDPTAHAEMIAITQAAAALKSKFLSGAEMYVTLEPCPMCAMAAVLAKLKKLVFATHDPRTGAAGSIMNILQNSHLNHKVHVEHGIMGEECSRLLREFFRAKR